MKAVNIKIITGGDGLWSSSQKEVSVTGLELIHYEDCEWGELRAHFDRNTWNVYEDGLVYTDSKFIDELRVFLKSNGFAGAVHYSEQGMQDVGYVSLDADPDFVKSWLQKEV